MVNRKFRCEECGETEEFCLPGKVKIRCSHGDLMVEVKKSKKKK